MLVFGILLLSQPMPQIQSLRVSAAISVPAAVDDAPDEENYRPEAYRSYRSPRSGYTGGGNRSGVTPGTTADRAGRRPGVNDPVTRTPNAPANRFGGFFGGILAGTLLGSLINPFGFGVDGGFSFVGLLFWAVILYFAYRIVRKLLGRAR